MPIIPINRIKDREKLVKALDGYTPDWRKFMAYPQHPSHRNIPQWKPETSKRFLGNNMARRYVTGQLDFDYLMHQIVDVIHKVKDGDMFLTEPEKALLSLVFPGFKNSMTKKFVQTYLQVTDEETQALRLKLHSFLATQANWQAGQGGGAVPGSDTIRRS